MSSLTHFYRTFLACILRYDTVEPAVAPELCSQNWTCLAQHIPADFYLVQQPQTCLMRVHAIDFPQTAKFRAANCITALSTYVKLSG